MLSLQMMPQQSERIDAWMAVRRMRLRVRMCESSEVRERRKSASECSVQSRGRVRSGSTRVLFLVTRVCWVAACFPRSFVFSARLFDAAASLLDLFFFLLLARFSFAAVTGQAKSHFFIVPVSVCWMWFLAGAGAAPHHCSLTLMDTDVANR